MDFDILDSLSKKADDLNALRNTINGQKTAYLIQLDEVNNEIQETTKLSQEREKASLILSKAGGQARDNARQHFESIITEALQFITQSTDYAFIVEEMSTRSKPSYEFYVESTVNGVRAKQKPQEANGGGFIDIISMAIKYAYLEIFNDPKIMNQTIFLDEPGKMISEQMSVKFAEYVKFLGDHFGKQTIMITHNNNLSSTADKNFIVEKNNVGYSEVKELNSIIENTNSVFDLFSEEDNKI